MNADAEHYATIQKLQRQAIVDGRRAWREVNPQNLSRSWKNLLPVLTVATSGVQARAATAGATYGAASLADRGSYVAPEAFVNPATFVGWSADGALLESVLYTPVISTLNRIGQGYPQGVAMRYGRNVLDSIMRTQVTDTSRSAAGADIATRPGVGYTRFLNPPSCSRCVVLAGKFYRWNAGFKRHDRCDCVHRLTTASSLDAAKAEGLISDPYDYFQSLSAEEQARIFTKAGARAIDDGADIFQVVNSRRGMRNVGDYFTTEGITRRGYAGGLLKRGQRRMTPQGIYRVSKTRAVALRELERHGYILPGGQTPTGAIVGQREGFGALGRGGTRTAASRAVLDARRTGVRDPRNRYTMTEAERRLNDARRDYETALGGRSPYTSPGFGNTPDPYGLGVNRTAASIRPATAAEKARAELHYRRMLATGGQKFVG